MFCEAFPDLKFLFFTDNSSPLLYYSHLPAIFVSILVGLFIFFKSGKSLQSKILLSVSLMFSVWALINLFVWTSPDSRIVLFLWSFFGIIYAAISLLSVYFIYVFIDGKDISFNKKIAMFFLMLPVILFTSSKLNLNIFDIPVCGATGYEGFIYTTYYYLVGAISLFWILFVGVKRYFENKDLLKRKQIILVTTGLSFFMLFFFLAGFLASYLTNNGYIHDFGLEMYGLFGMLFFLAFLAYLIVKFKAFDIKMIGAQALVISLVILIGSQFTYARATTSIVLNSIALVLSGSIGLVLVRSVKKLDTQKILLENSNREQETLIHFISHQVKGYFTKSRNIFSTLLDEKERMPRDLVSYLDEGLRSDKEGIKTVEDILNASNLKNGKMQYEKLRIDLIKIINEVIADNKIKLESKDLKLNFYHTGFDTLEIDADPARMKDVFNNLVQNAINYTLKGGINILVEKNNNKTRISIKDTGVGLSDDDKQKIFQSGGRGSEALKYNANSTGYGLFIAKKIVEAHNMYIWGESEGRDKGAKFVVEF